MTAHAYAVLDAFIYGFAFDEAMLPEQAEGEEFVALAEDIAAGFDDDTYPNLADFIANHVMKPGYNFGDSFEFGLDLILDGLDAAAGDVE